MSEVFNQMNFKNTAAGMVFFKSNLSSSLQPVNEKYEARTVYCILVTKLVGQIFHALRTGVPAVINLK